MDIEAFYQANEARRESPEYEFGDSWRDARGNSYRLSWVEATGELYLMIEPEAVVSEDIFGDFLVAEESVEGLSVVVIATVPSLLAVEDRLRGWEDVVDQENSLKWLHRRLGTADDD